MTPDNCKSIRIPVLVLGKGWLAVDKPAGMSVHNQSGGDLCSVVQKELAHGGEIDTNPNFGVNPVNRLDKEASGVIILASTRNLFRFFSKQFESREVKKSYIALLHGRLESLEGNASWGTWRRSLAKTAGGRLNPEGSGPRQPSETSYRVIDHSTHYTMVEIEPLTGRKHQIRRHAKLAGHPVVGDGRYGPTRALTFLRQNFAFNRIALHARTLTLKLPDGNKPTTIKTPSIPVQMQQLFENDRLKPGPGLSK